MVGTLWKLSGVNEECECLFQITLGFNIGTCAERLIHLSACWQIPSNSLSMALRKIPSDPSLVYFGFIKENKNKEREEWIKKVELRLILSREGRETRLTTWQVCQSTLSAPDTKDWLRGKERAIAVGNARGVRAPALGQQQVRFRPIC